MDKHKLLFIYIEYIYELKMLIIEKKKIPSELIDTIKQLQFVIKNYDRFQRMINQLGRKRNRAKLHSKDEYFKQIDSIDYVEINKVR